jgi:octaprenyl-diphosphate synthase
MSTETPSSATSSEREQDALRAATAELFAIVRPEMDRVEEILQRELQNDAPFVDELLKYGCLLGGKRLRPALVLLTAKACGQVTDAHYTLAAVVEMIHTATLIHDDVLDEADMRRHLATVNSRWDNQVSVLLGDYLFTHAFYLASTLGDAFACQTIGKSTNIVCEGELRQVGRRGDFQLSEQDYLGIVGAKTAELCACCCRLGAHYAGSSPAVVSKLHDYGWQLGTAFQIADDILDLVGETSATGKSLGTDLEKRKPTLPLIHALGQLAPDTKHQILTALESELDAEALRTVIDPILQQHGSIDYARRKARSLASDAADCLAVLQESPSRDVLATLSAFVVSRTM